MKKFKIYGFSNGNAILITDSENISPAATFDETMNLEWHMKSSMSFKISDSINGEKNPYIDLIYPGAKIRLVLYKNGGHDTYDYIIKTVNSEFAQENIIYSIGAEDFASVVYSKEAQGLTLDYTGTLKEIIYEILFQSRKNLNYRNLNKNYINFSSFFSKSETLIASNFGVSKTLTKNETLYITFYRDVKLPQSAVNASVNIIDLPSAVTVTLDELDDGGVIIKTQAVDTISDSLYTINFTPTKYTSFFRFNFNLTGTGLFTATDFKIKLDDTAVFNPSVTTYLQLDLDPITGFNEDQFKGELGDTSYYKKATIQVSNSNLYNGLIEAAKLFNGIIYFDYVNNMINVVNRETFYSYKGYRLSPTFNLLSLSRDEDYSEFNSVLHISGNENVYSIYPAIPSEFKVYFQNCIDNGFINNIYTPTTQTINSIVPHETTPQVFIITVSGAGYIENEFKDKFIRLYSGEYIDKRYLILSNTTNTITIKVNNGFVPSSTNTFKVVGDYFETLGTGTNEFTYSFLANEIVKAYITPEDNYEERAKLIDNFAKAADKVPNFENILYSLDYFYKIGKISETNYNNFKNKINNDLRKLNIKLRTYGERYQNAISILSEKDSLIDENLRIDVADLQTLRQIEIDLISTTVEDPTWQGLQNQRQDIEQDMFDRKSKTLDLFNFTYSADIGTLSHIIEDIELNTAAIPYKIKANSYTSLMLNAYGYYNIYKNGIKQKIDELNILISRYENEVASNSARITTLAALIEDIGNEEDPISIEYSVEKAGLETRNENLVYYIGDSIGGTYPINGVYKTKKAYLQNILNIIGNHLYRETLIDYSEWIVGSPTISNWTYTGTVDTVMKNNKDDVSDLMMRITGTGAVRATNISLTTDSYLAQGLFKIPSYTSGTITIKLVYVPPSGDIPELSFTFPSANYDRWLGFNFKPNSTGSNAYWFPSESPIGGVTSKYNSISVPGSGYELNYAFSGTGSVYLYRPRMELLNSARYTISDIYFLYDNPLMINYEEDLKLEFNLIEGLYDLLYNENYPANISVAKQELLNELYATYEPFLIEGYYENSDEIDSEGLLEQALISFGLYSYPRINYGVSVIDMSAIEGYEFINVEVGDKIKIAEETDRLYKSYQPEDTKYLQVSQIAYDLRQPQSTTLTVAQDDENRKLLQYIIKAVS